jgi:hypothetical protein
MADEGRPDGACGRLLAFIYALSGCFANVSRLQTATHVGACRVSNFMHTYGY